MRRWSQLSFLQKSTLMVLLVTGAAGGYWYYQTYQSEGIYAYNAATDRDFIIHIFREDWYWLISDFSSKTYSVEHMLDFKTSSYDDKGNLIIKTYRVKGKPVGFVTYYLKELFEGRILFLAIDKKERSKGYARKLAKYAINDLKKRGANVVRLITRTDNVGAQKLYKSLGFKEVWNDGGYMKFEKEV